MRLGKPFIPRQACESLTFSNIILLIPLKYIIKQVTLPLAIGFDQFTLIIKWNGK